MNIKRSILPAQLNIDNHGRRGRESPAHPEQWQIKSSVRVGISIRG